MKCRYAFELVCPQCKMISSVTLQKIELERPMNCGNCLHNDAKIVAMTIVRTTVEDGE